MQPFTVHTGVAAPLRRTNVDTDQIIPVRFLTRSTVEGYGENLFNDWREDPGFVLNDDRYADASVLVAGTDFGTGSSREAAVWALSGWGFRAVLAPRFGDIFRGNALKNGLLPVGVPQRFIEKLWDLLDQEAGTPVTVDLEQREVRAGGLRQPFELEEHARRRLLNGLDDTAVTLQHADDIAAYEARRRPALPTTGRRSATGADALVTRLLALTDMTSVVADALDRFPATSGRVADAGLVPLRAGQKVCGTAVTMRCVAEEMPVEELLEAGRPPRFSYQGLLSAARKGDVAVIDCTGHHDVAVLGGRTAQRGVAAGLAGYLVDGAVRDVEDLTAIGVRVWSRTRSPRAALHRLHVAEVNGPVHVAGLTVHPGDLVLADDTGVVVLGRAEAERVVTQAERLAAEEAADDVTD